MDDSDYNNDKTLSSRPLPRRPRWGWGAWESTIGYIASHHNPDVSLKLQAYPLHQSVAFSASLVWADYREDVKNSPDIGTALKALWQEVDKNHQIYSSINERFRSPIGYEMSEWLDDTTADVLARLIRSIQQLFEEDWVLLIVYRPVENADKRLQLRLLAQSNHIQRAVQGNSLVEVCRSLLHQCVIIMAEQQKND